MTIGTSGTTGALGAPARPASATAAGSSTLARALCRGNTREPQTTPRPTITSAATINGRFRGGAAGGGGRGRGGKATPGLVGINGMRESLSGCGVKGPAAGRYDSEGADGMDGDDGKNEVRSSSASSASICVINPARCASRSPAKSRNPAGHLRRRRHGNCPLDGVGELRRARVASLRLPRRRSRDHDLERRRDVRRSRADLRHVAVQHLHQQLRFRAALQRALADQHLPQHQAGRIHVRLRRDVASHLLGREVGDLAAHAAVGGRDEPPVGLRHAEVDDLGGAVGADEHVLRRGVAMDDAEQVSRVVASLVRRLQPAQRVADDGGGDAHRHPHAASARVGEEARERLAVEVIHDGEDHDAVGHEVDDPDDVRMDDVPREAHLVEEPRHRRGIARQPLVQALDGDRERLPPARDPEMDGRRRAPAPSASYRA